MIADPHRDLIGVPLDRARTLPGPWYSDAAHHEIELDIVFGHEWVNVGSADDVAAPGSYLASTAGRLPVLVVRDEAGTLRAFLNVCRHRGAPLASGCGHARALSCPYHAWLYRLDGSLSRAGGVGEPVGFDRADFGLREIRVATFARSILVNLDRSARSVRSGPLGAGLEPYRLDELEIGERTHYECHFNWKVLLENYCENYHTPFIHSQLPVAGYEYPIECAGNVVFAWDRPLEPARPVRAGAARPSSRRRPGWAAVADVAADESFNNGSYLGVVPEHRGLVLRRVRRDVPADPDRARRRRVVEREYSGTRRCRPSGGRPTSPPPARSSSRTWRSARRSSAPTTPGCRPTACCRPSTSPGSPTSTSSSLARRGLTQSATLRGAGIRRGRAIAAEQRRQQILDATHRVTLERGLHDLRIADVAAELGVSTGLIHYHFATRDELIEAMLRETAAAEVAAVRRRSRASTRPRPGWPG